MSENPIASQLRPTRPMSRIVKPRPPTIRVPPPGWVPTGAILFPSNPATDDTSSTEATDVSIPAALRPGGTGSGPTIEQRLTMGYGLLTGAPLTIPEQVNIKAHPLMFSLIIEVGEDHKAESATVEQVCKFDTHSRYGLSLDHR